MIKLAVDELAGTRNDLGTLVLTPAVVAVLSSGGELTALDGLEFGGSEHVLLPVNVLNMHWVLLQVTRENETSSDWRGILYDSLPESSPDCIRIVSRTIRAFARISCRTAGSPPSQEVEPKEMPLTRAELSLMKGNGADCGCLSLTGFVISLWESVWQAPRMGLTRFVF